MIEHIERKNHNHLLDVSGDFAHSLIFLRKA